jgi:hypothetical protein
VALQDSIIFRALAEADSVRGRELACLSLLLLSASCVPLQAKEAPAKAQIGAEKSAATPASVPGAPAVEPPPMVLRDVPATEALAINASIPIALGPNPHANAFAFRPATPLDGLRSLQCLAEAVYYEARSESLDGQRAVAQVVLNRVRHPAYPGSVCGVVYQGPLRAGGGCQFTFTCDGSLGWTAAGEAWLRARRIASEALAGAVYAPVGLATHYHTQQVLPDWAFRLAKIAVIGSHNFYRMPGSLGQPDAFRKAYSGREPSPATVMASRLPINLGRKPLPASLPLALGSLPLAAPGAYALMPSSRLPAAPAAQSVPPPVNDRLPQSRVKPEFENSGRWLTAAGRPSAP